MNKSYFLIILLLISKISYPQNLLPNGGFEQFSGCPTPSSHLDSLLYWINPSVGGITLPGTPDYYNACGSPIVRVPSHGLGYQEAHDGVAYTGIGLWTTNPNFREYVETPLISTLLAGQCYHVEFYCNLRNPSKYSSDAIGAYFSDTIIQHINNYYPLPFVPQISNIQGNVFDTLNWTLIEGDYVATGGENYLVIGNFKNDSQTDTFVVNSTGADPTSVYVYVDDISVVLSACNVGLSEPSTIPSVEIYPNPVTEKLNVRIIGSDPTEITLYDVASRKLVCLNFISSISINTTHFANGIYFYEVRNKEGVIRNGKLVKE